MTGFRLFRRPERSRRGNAQLTPATVRRGVGIRDPRQSPGKSRAGTYREIGLFRPEDVYGKLFVECRLSKSASSSPISSASRTASSLSNAPLGSETLNSVGSSSTVSFPRLVDLDMLLHAAHHRPSQMSSPTVIGNLAQRHDRVLVSSRSSVAERRRLFTSLRSEQPS
jgi:hypothetical protein